MDDFDGEIWKNINTAHAYANENYEVSNCGRVKNINNGVILLAEKMGDYHRVTIQTDVNKSGKFFVHRLVAFTFQSYEGNQSDYDVDHIDKKPNHNNEYNLKIMTRKDHMIKDHGIKVLAVFNNKYFIFNSYSSAGDFLKISPKRIAQSIARHGIAGGYKWFKLASIEAQEILKNDKYELMHHDHQL